MARRAIASCFAMAALVTPGPARAQPVIDTGPYKFSSEAFFADNASVTGVLTGYFECNGGAVYPPYDPADIGLWVTGYTPKTMVLDLGQVDSIYCSQDGQELELGFTDVMPYETNGPDVVVFDHRPYWQMMHMLVAVRPVGDAFGELVLYGPDAALPVSPTECGPDPHAFGIDFHRHGLLPGVVVDRIKIVADCGVTPHASEYMISMAAVVDHSCAVDEDCDDQSDCTSDWCGDDGLCKTDPYPAGTACAGGYCTGSQIPDCLACLEDMHCAVPTPYCHPYESVCVACVTDAECNAPEPYCDVAVHTCAPCLDQLDCSDGNECTLDTCSAEGCHSQLHSKGTPCSVGICDGNPQGAACVDCIEDADCPEERPFCRDDGACTACRDGHDCDDGDPCTEDACAGGDCVSFLDGECPVEVGGAPGDEPTGGTSGIGGAGGAGGIAQRDADGCDCAVGSRRPARGGPFLIGLLGLGIAIHRRRRGPQR